MPAASLNTLSAFNPEYWAKEMQDTFYKESTALAIASTELRADLKDGDVVHKPFGSYPRVQTYTKGADIVVKDLESTDETLTVATAKVASFYVDDIDRVQNKWDVASRYAQDAMRQLNNNLDQAVLAEYSNAGKTVDDGDIGGTAGNGIVVSTSNIAGLFTASGRELNGKKRTSRDRFAMIGPRLLETIQNYVGARETGFGEEVSANGMVGKRFGFDLMLTNNLPFTATFDGSTILVDTETVTINGVVFTADADGAAVGAGHFSIQANATLCNAQLASAINDDGTPGVDEYIALSADDRQLIEEAGIVATIDGTDLKLTGFGDIVVSEASAGAWSAETQYSLMGIRGAIDLVTQVTPNVVFRDAQLRLGKYVHPWMLYGKKTFTRNTDSLVAVQFDVGSWV